MAPNVKTNNEHGLKKDRQSRTFRKRDHITFSLMLPPDEESYWRAFSSTGTSKRAQHTTNTSVQKGAFLQRHNWNARRAHKTKRPTNSRNRFLNALSRALSLSLCVHMYGTCTHTSEDVNLVPTLIPKKGPSDVRPLLASDLPAMAPSHVEDPQTAARGLGSSTLELGLDISAAPQKKR